jgi:hypothetical protein
MADFYSHTYGRLCWECKKELQTMYCTDIGDFMRTPKKEAASQENINNWERIVDNEFQ